MFKLFESHWLDPKLDQDLLFRMNNPDQYRIKKLFAPGLNFQEWPSLPFF